MRARLRTALNTFAGYPRTRPLRASDRVTCAGQGGWPQIHSHHARDGRYWVGRMSAGSAVVPRQFHLNEQTTCAVGYYTAYRR